MSVTDKISIVFVIPCIGKGGGSEAVVAKLVSNMNLKKYSMHLVLLTEAELPIASSDIFENVTVHFLGQKRVLFSAPKLWMLLMKIKPHIVFSTLTYVNILVGFLIPFYFSSKTSFIARESTIPSINHQQKKCPNLWDFLLRHAYFNYKKIICQSSDMYADLSLVYRISESKLRIIFNPCEMRFPIKRNNILIGSPLKLLCVAMLRPEKGVSRLIDFLSYLKLDFICLIIGEGSERQMIESKIMEYNLGNKVKLLGYQNNVYNYMIESDILVQSSYVEGMPNVVIEAGSVGLPTVAISCVGGTKDVILEGLNGYHKNIDSPESFSLALNRIVDGEIGDPQSIAHFIEGRFGVNKICQDYEELFEEIIT